MSLGRSASGFSTEVDCRAGILLLEKLAHTGHIYRRPLGISQACPAQGEPFFAPRLIDHLAARRAFPRARPALSFGAGLGGLAQNGTNRQP